jgi:hypothetical protein
MQFINGSRYKAVLASANDIDLIRNSLRKRHLQQSEESTKNVLLKINKIKTKYKRINRRKQFNTEHNSLKTYFNT